MYHLSILIGIFAYTVIRFSKSALADLVPVSFSAPPAAVATAESVLDPTS